MTSEHSSHPEGRRRLPDSDIIDDSLSASADSLNDLRRILLGNHTRQVAKLEAQIAELEAEVDEMERRLADRGSLTEMVAAVLGDALRIKIREAREEIIEALYPIIGSLVVRAVSEAIQDLAQAVDARVHTSFTPQTLWWRLRARVGGVSEAEASLREALPFEVTEVILIHRESGLLLQHLSHDSEASDDSDVISGLLTAIRDFADDVLGSGDEADLDYIKHGDRRFLIEAARHVYLAVEVDGIEPPGFRAEMRECIIEIENAYVDKLRNYAGDAQVLAPAVEILQRLMRSVGAEEDGLSPSRNSVWIVLLALIFVCIALLFCLAGAWLIRNWLQQAAGGVQALFGGAV